MAAVEHRNDHDHAGGYDAPLEFCLGQPWSWMEGPRVPWLSWMGRLGKLSKARIVASISDCVSEGNDAAQSRPGPPR
jgi:hypothetical protein